MDIFQLKCHSCYIQSCRPSIVEVAVEVPYYGPPLPFPHQKLHNQIFSINAPTFPRATFNCTPTPPARAPKNVKAIQPEKYYGNHVKGRSG